MKPYSLTQLIVALCQIGLVQLKLSKTGMRIIFVNNEYAALVRHLCDGTINADYREIKQGSQPERRVFTCMHDLVADVFGIELDEHAKDRALLTPSTIAAACETHQIGARVSKTGIRLYAVPKDGSDDQDFENADRFVKIRHKNNEDFIEFDIVDEEGESMTDPDAELLSYNADGNALVNALKASNTLMSMLAH